MSVTAGLSSTRGRRALGALALASVLFLALFSGCPSFIKGKVPNETGFEGAVTVVGEETDGGYGVVTVKVPYIGIRGDAKEGLARMVVSRKSMTSGKPVPALCHVHYEKKVSGAKHWAKRGWAVFTAVYTDEKGGYPIDAAVANGYNEARAIIQWARRLPFIDRTRLHIDGGSQGGYMALAMSADTFPVTATTADCPVVNWSYNLQYFEANRAASKFPAKMEDSPLPILCSVTGLADACYKSYPRDLSADTWYFLSPISCVDRIANPVLVTCATGDMLVPMEQMTRQPLPAFDPQRFPEGYQRAFDALTPCVKARKTFEECIPENQRETFWIPLQKNSFELTLDMFKNDKMKPKKRPKEVDKPWSKDRQWSLLYQNEGPPTPCASHVSHEWAMAPHGFANHYQQAAPAPALLNAAKLEWLMRRYSRVMMDVPLLENGQPANRLNSVRVEQQDVVQGLLDYAGLGAEYEARLVELYARCPLKPLGESITVPHLRKLLAEIQTKP